MVEDFFIARPRQEAAVELVSTPAWERHLRARSTALRERCTVLAGALARETPDRNPPGCRWGFCTGGSPRDRPTSRSQRPRGRTEWSSTRARRSYPAEPPDAYLRLVFAAAADPAELTEGAAASARRCEGAGC